MATSKQPAFPHPPLDTGVAKYPTPLVPNYHDKTGGWGITDQGHIILREKVSIEKGSFTPLPLDGSVTYTGRDANRWPDSLYLVAEEPTEDGQFIYRYWANARTTTSQNPWNYNIAYSSENPSFPIYSRTYITRRVDYTPVVAGTNDPVYGSPYKVVKQEMQELPDGDPLRSLFVVFRVIYEPIPGPAVTSKKLNSMGAVETVTSQVVQPGTTVDLTGLVVSDSVDAESSLKSVRSRVTMDSLPADFNYYEATRDLGFIKNTVSILQRNITGGTPPPPDITGNVLDVSDSPMEFPYVKRTIKTIQTDELGNPVLPPAYTFYQTGTYTFPGIIYSWDVSLVDGQIQQQLSYFNNRYPVTLTVPLKHVVTYQVGEPNISNLRFFKVITQPWAQEFFKVPDNTVHPPAPVSLIGQTIYQNGISYGIQGGQASTPTSYIVGQQLLIAGQTERWMGNIWKTILIYAQEPPATY